VRLTVDFLLSGGFWAGVQALVTALAVVVGGIWFFRARRRYPKARVEHEVWSWKTGEDERVVRVVITVENRGEVLLQLGNAMVRLHRVLPMSEEVQAQMAAVKQTPPNMTAYLEWTPYYQQGTDWTMSGGELEPGESDELCYHFVVPQDIETVIVYSFLQNRRKVREPFPREWSRRWRYITKPEARRRHYGWNKSSVHRLGDGEVAGR
jgi:hypothetical protein